MGGAGDVTVVSWNALGSQGMDVPAVADALDRFAPDIVLLQEVQRRQLGALGTAMGRIHAGWRLKHWPIRVPAEGLGILARVPLVDLRVQPLARRWRFWSWRRRIALHVALVVDEKPVRVVNVHLGAGVGVAERARQVHALLEAAPHARVIAGDLNASPGASELAPFAALGYEDVEQRVRGHDAATPTNWAPGPRTTAPSQRLDYVLVRPDVRVDEGFVPDDWERWSALSDHLPVVARLRF